MIRAFPAPKVLALLAALLTAGVLLAGESPKGTPQKTDELDAKIKELQAGLEGLSKYFAAKLKAAHAKLAVAEQKAERALAEAKRRQEEVKLLGEVVQKREAEIVRLREEATKYRNQALTQADAARTAVQRAEKLLKRLQEKERQVAPMEKGAQPERDKAANPPPQYVKGKVLKVDQKDAQLVEISLGKDAGLKKGHTLEVYRMKPRPEYLGRIQIVEAMKDRATGRRLMMAPDRKVPKLEVGDEVASSIR